MATPTTLPASFTAGQVLTATQMNNLRGAFRILQVVTSSYSTQTSSSTTTYADTGLSVSITPQSTSSKILVIANQTGLYKDTNNIRGFLRLMRGSSELTVFEKYYGWSANNNEIGVGGSSVVFLDSPATTSATTYKTQFASNANAAAVFVQTGGSASTIAVFEVSA